MCFVMEFSESDCLEALNEAANQLGRTPTMDEYDSMNLSPSASTIADHCGTWQLAVAKAGLDRKSHREYTEENCINALKNAADIIGSEPSLSKYNELGLRPSASTIQEIFGSWSEAKKAAGVKDYGEQSPEQEAREFFDKFG